jgi:hypothetical protein
MSASRRSRVSEKARVNVTIVPTQETVGHAKSWSRPALLANLARDTSDPIPSPERAAKVFGRVLTALEYQALQTRLERKAGLAGSLARGDGRPPG